MAGHVFVVHGDLLRISADALLIPCDAAGQVLATWAPFGPSSDPGVLAQELTDSRYSEPRTIDAQHLRYVDTGATTHTADIAWLEQGVRSALDALIGDVGQLKAANHRARPLVAMPLFGVGAGGFDAVRGEALGAQLDAAQHAVDRADVDVVIVCFLRSDFAAVQLQRADTAWGLPEELREHADSLAAAIKAGRLVLFIGAGVSAAAGVVDFAGLVTGLEEAAGMTPGLLSGTDDLPARVAALKSTERNDKWINDRVAALVDRGHYSLTHGLLASLRVREAITTNFDRLYEKACERPFADTPLEVLPWGRGAGQNPWLLKAHGDPWERGSLVLDEPSFKNFEKSRAPTAGVVRAMFALSREVLFVGYSLKDKNIERLVEEADHSHRSLGALDVRLGTIVDIESVVTELDSNPARLGIQPHEDATIAESALWLQVLLDYVLWAATNEEASWLLDKRYAALHKTEGETRAAELLAGAELPSSGNWPVVIRRLTQFGRRP